MMNHSSDLLNLSESGKAIEALNFVYALENVFLLHRGVHVYSIGQLGGGG